MPEPYRSTPQPSGQSIDRGPSNTTQDVSYLLYLDELSYVLSPSEDPATVEAELAEAARTGTSVSVTIRTAFAGETKAEVRPGNARIVYVAQRPFADSIGKPGHKL